jgi:hypothetical protein
LIFVIDELIIINWREVSWHESIRNIGKHGPLVQGIELKKSPERSENVIKQVVGEQLRLDGVGKQVQVHIVRVKSLHFVKLPEIVEIPLNLDLEGLGERRPILEPLEGLEPAVEIFSPVHDAHLLLVGAENLDEITDNVRKECHSKQHDYDGENLLNPTDRVVISIAHRRQSCQSEIAGGVNLPT